MYGGKEKKKDSYVFGKVSSLMWVILIKLQWTLVYRDVLKLYYTLYVRQFADNLKREIEKKKKKKTWAFMSENPSYEVI